MKAEEKLLRPVYEILNTDDKYWFEDKWEFFKANHESASQYKSDIKEVITFTQDKLKELASYLNEIKQNKQSEGHLKFFIEYTEILLSNTKHYEDFIIQYMFLYKELLEGSQRYIYVLNELKTLEKRF